MQIDVVAPAELDPADIAAWTRLQREHRALSSPYLSPSWVQSVAAVDGPDRRDARVAVIREGGEAKGFYAVRAGRFTALPIGAPMCDYQGLVAAPGLKVSPRAIARALGVGRIDFHNHLADQEAFAPHMRGFTEGQVIDLSAGYDAYVEERRAAGTSIIKDTAKKRRKLEAEHGAPVFAESRDMADFDRLIAWKREQYAQTGQTDIFNAGWPLDLLRSLFESGDPTFGGRLFTLRVGDKLLAAHLALSGDDILHAWFIAHDDDYARYSPGVILILEILQWAAGRGYQEFDFGSGDQRFKVQLASRQRPVAHGFVGRPGPASLMRAAEYKVRAAAEALPLGRASALPGKAMRRWDLMRSLA